MEILLLFRMATICFCQAKLKNKSSSCWDTPIARSVLMMWMCLTLKQAGLFICGLSVLDGVKVGFVNLYVMGIICHLSLSWSAGFISRSMGMTTEYGSALIGCSGWRSFHVAREEFIIWMKFLQDIAAMQAILQMFPIGNTKINSLLLRSLKQSGPAYCFRLACVDLKYNL